MFHAAGALLFEAADDDETPEEDAEDDAPEVDDELDEPADELLPPESAFVELLPKTVL
jgi:hypothetical protein